MQFGPTCKTSFNVIERKRSLRMPGDLDALPCGQLTVNLAARFAQLSLNRLDSRIEIDVMLIGMCFEVLQPPFQVEDRFFKIERLDIHVCES